MNLSFTVEGETAAEIEAAAYERADAFFKWSGRQYTLFIDVTERSARNTAGETAIQWFVANVKATSPLNREHR